jgi:hypothetical protein
MSRTPQQELGRRNPAGDNAIYHTYRASCRQKVTVSY